MAKLAPSFNSCTPSGDDRPRPVCTHCGFVDYINPKIVAGIVCAREGRLLLCQRDIQPRRGFWTIPAGFMELGESVEAAAVREAREEAGAEVELDGLLGVYSVPHLGQVHMMFRGTLRNEAQAGDETQAVKMVCWEEIDWDSLAFPTVVSALKDWFAVRDQAGITPVFRSHFDPIGDD